MLKTSVDLDRQIREKHNLQESMNERIENCYLALDTELSEVANTSEWFKVWKIHAGKHDEGLTVDETVLKEVGDAMDFFLLLAYLNQWNHLIVIDEHELEAYQNDSRKMNLTKTFLNIKKMLFGAYSYNRSTDYQHAWHLFIKFCLNGLGFTPKQIEEAFFNKNTINYKRQENNY